MVEPAPARPGTLSWLQRGWAGLKSGTGPGRDFNGRLGRALDRMELITRVTEDDFLGLSGQVREFFLSAQTLMDQGAQVADLVSGGEILETMGRLDRLVEESNADISSSRTGFKEVMEILDSVRRDAWDARSPLSGFNHIVMGLRMLGISTRIESAKLEGRDEGFQFLATQVSSLSDTIQERTEGIAARMDALSGQLDQALKNLTDLVSGVGGGLGGILSVVRESLEELKDRRSRSQRSAARIAALAKEVGENIGEVVVSVQYHDITRQRLEHVRDTLAGLREGKGGAPAAEVCRLQTALLDKAFHDLDNAAKTMRDSLRAIAVSVGQVAGEAQTLMQGDDVQERSFMERLEKDLSGIMDASSELRRAVARLRDLVESVAATLEEAGASLKSIDNISYSLKFVALNAAIKAARLGGRGSALESLAAAIQGLSIDSQTATRELEKVLARMSGSAGKLRLSMTSAQSPGQGGGEVLESVLESLHESGRTCGRMLGELERGGRDLAEGLEEAAAGISFHSRLAEDFREVARCLENAPGRGLLALVPNGRGRTGGPDSLARSYTMASEREIHQAWSRSGSGTAPAYPPAPAGSYGESPCGPEPAAFLPPASGAEPDDDLGDNVELF